MLLLNLMFIQKSYIYEDDDDDLDEENNLNQVYAEELEKRKQIEKHAQLLRNRVRMLE